MVGHKQSRVDPAERKKLVVSALQRPLGGQELPGESFPALLIQPLSILYFLEYAWDESIGHVGCIPCPAKCVLPLLVGQLRQ